ncbi:MAG: NYN domain-containing protein [Candidatus Nealsonbacteria bacterium]
MRRVAVFIDNSNIFHCLHNLKKIDGKWICLYNPLILAQKLAGDRQLVYVGFYCCHPPSYLLGEGGYSETKYKKAMKYYGAIEKMPEVTIKYGYLKGSKGNLVEKNLDTQVSSDLLTKADEYDTAIIVSNDGDYVSPVLGAKNKFNKKIEVAYFKGLLSMNLGRVCDVPRRLRPSYFVKIDLP